MYLSRIWYIYIYVMSIYDILVFSTLWLNLVALTILGVAISLAVIPTFDKILDAAE